MATNKHSPFQCQIRPNGAPFLAEHIKAFKARGGKIQHIRTGISVKVYDPSQITLPGTPNRG